jgi:uncharacterized protein YigA (DUF484 family)
MTMSNPTPPPASLPSAFGQAITEDDIADYLLKTPDFFERHAQLLAAVKINSPHSQRAVSLQERQALMLREKIKLLELRIMDMIRNVNENKALSDKLLGWARTLFLETDALALPDLMVQELKTQFAVPQAVIKVWGVSPRYAECDFAQGASDDVRIFAASLPEPFCGVNTGLEVANCLPDPHAAASLAILPLRDPDESQAGAAFGVLVLASPDAQRFDSTLGTEFLSLIAELASAALTPLR